MLQLFSVIVKTYTVYVATCKLGLDPEPKETGAALAPPILWSRNTDSILLIPVTFKMQNCVLVHILTNRKLHISGLVELKSAIFYSPQIANPLTAMVRKKGR
jgi:hypothetical protein